MNNDVIHVCFQSRFKVKYKHLNKSLISITCYLHGLEHNKVKTLRFQLEKLHKSTITLLLLLLSNIILICLVVKTLHIIYELKNVVQTKNWEAKHSR